MTLIRTIEHIIVTTRVNDLNVRVEFEVHIYYTVQ